MKIFKHYSFDLWMTLIRSNPTFKEKRSAYFFQHHNPLHKTPAEVAGIFRQIDKTANAINEKTGKNIDADELYLWVIAALNDYRADNLRETDPEALYQTLETLLWEYPPVLCDPCIPELLAQISQFATINLLSNTGFIKGATLRKVLDMHDLSQFFTFQLYSDETGYSKPNPRFFEMMISMATDLHPQQPLLAEDIIHVGDNPVADIAGAQTAGIGHFFVQSHATLITDLLNRELFIT